MNIPHNTIREAARLAACALHDAEARLAKAERDLDRARELAALTDGLLMAAYTQEATERANRSTNA